MPTPTLEEYLETIYKLAEHGDVKPTAIAEAMSVSGPTVTNTLKRLEVRGFVTREGTAVLLTDEGSLAALDIVRKHRVAERFLVDVLGLGWEEAHEDACRLEHAMSPRVLEALETYLSNPEVCPHGQPIPRPDGHVVVVPGRALADLLPGDSGDVIRVSEEDEALLTYLRELGLVPGATVLVVDVAPFAGPLTIDVDGKRSAIDRSIAEKVFVAR